MIYISYYESPVGKILLAVKHHQLIGLWIEGQKHYLQKFQDEIVEKQDDVILVKTKLWLDQYFHGERPEITELPLNPVGSDFRKMVWNLLIEIPYGNVTTYGAIAKKIEEQTGKRMSAQAVGGAVGHNPISIIIPCHRVIGQNGNLTGYAGGIDKKIKLLELEQVDPSEYFI